MLSLYVVPLISISAPPRVTEGDTELLCVNVTGLLQREIDVTLLTSSPSASEGLDYTFNSTISLTFSPGASQEICEPFSALPDDIVEEDEDVFIAINSSLADIPESEVTVVIVDNSTVSFAFANDSYVVAEGETVPVCVELTEGVIARDIPVVLDTNNTGTCNCMEPS